MFLAGNKPPLAFVLPYPSLVRWICNLINRRCLAMTWSFIESENNCPELEFHWCYCHPLKGLINKARLLTTLQNWIWMRLSFGSKTDLVYFKPLHHRLIDEGFSRGSRSAAIRLGTTIMDNKSRMIMHCFCVAWHSKELEWWIWCFGSQNWNFWILLVVACHDQQSLVVATFIILPYFVPLWFFSFNKAHSDSTIAVVTVPFKPPVFPRRCIAGWNSQIFMVFPLVMFGASQMRCIHLSIRGSGWWSRVSFACWRWVGTVYIWWDLILLFAFKMQYVKT